MGHTSLATQKLKHLLQLQFSVNTLLITPDCRQLIASSGCNIQIWDLPTGAPLHTLPGSHTLRKSPTLGQAEPSWIQSLALSPDGKFLVSGSDDYLTFDPEFGPGPTNYEQDVMKVWDMTNGELIQQLGGYHDSISHIAVTQDGRVVTSRHESLSIWCLETGDRLKYLREYAKLVSSLAIDEVNQRIFGGSYDKTINVWCLQIGQLLSTLSGHQATIREIVVSPNGQTLVSGDEDGFIKVWTKIDS